MALQKLFFPIFRTMINCRRFILSLPAIVACAAPSPSPSSAPQPERDASPQPAETPALSASKTSWSFRPDPTFRSYTSISHTSLEATSDSGIIRDTVSTKVRFTAAINTTEIPAAIAGTVEELSIDGGSRIGSSDTGLISLPLPFKGTVNQGVVFVETNAQSAAGVPCQNPASSIITSIQNLVFLRPSELSKGKTWSDSTSTIACHGSLPVQVSTVHTYRVIGEVSSLEKQVVLIERTDRISVNGDGAQGQHRIFIKGFGSGSGKLHLDPVTGSTMASENESRSSITVRSSGQDLQFVQITRQNLRSNIK